MPASPRPKRVQIMDATAVERALSRIAHEILERTGPPTPTWWACAPAASLGAAPGRAQEGGLGAEPPVGALDITLYRDDLTRRARSPC